MSALYYSKKTEEYIELGNINSAIMYSKKAKKFNGFATFFVILGIIGIIIVVIITISNS